MKQFTDNIPYSYKTEMCLSWEKTYRYLPVEKKNSPALEKLVGHKITLIY